MNKEDFLKHTPTEFSNEDFYELCKAFMDVALNSEKIRMEDGSIGGKFYSDDILNASILINKYQEKYNIDDNLLKKSLRLYAHNSIEDDDTRQKMYFDQSSNKQRENSHTIGVLYNFTELPIGIVEEIFEKAKTMKS